MKPIKFTALAFAIFAATGLRAQTTTRAEYIERYKEIAVEQAEKYGIPASIKMAQGILESDNGNSRLATEGNNHFGIKCKSDWYGPTLFHDDDRPGECFRRYSTARQSWIDHSEFLDKGQRYQSLFDLPAGDYKAWAHGLKAAGYATNPRYPEMLIKIIEENQLYLLDKGKPLPSGTIISMEDWGRSEAGEAPVAERVNVDRYTVSLYDHNGYEVYSNNGAHFIVARPDDDLGKIAYLFGIPEKRLRKFNDMTETQQVAPRTMVYIQPKSARWDNGKVIHTVVAGETLHSIAQTYGIKEKTLARLNRLSVGVGLIPGQQIKLR